MSLSLKESLAVSGMARVLYGFLPGSGNAAWKGHVSFKTVAQSVGVGEFWIGGSKEPAIVQLLERTLEYRRSSFEKLILAIVRAGITYRQKNGEAIKENEIKRLNGFILEIGFKFPSLWDEDFLRSLRGENTARAEDLVEKELNAQKIKIDKQTDKAQKREGLKNTFYALCGLSDRQKAGLELEKVLNGLFENENLSPREPFRVVGEQIDGSFELDNEIYLLEAKWETPKISEAHLLIFRGKIEGKSTITRGVFISLSGYTDDAVTAITKGKQPNFFLLDGYDLTIALEGQVDLTKILKNKIRRLAEEGNVYYQVKEML